MTDMRIRINARTALVVVCTVFIAACASAPALAPEPLPEHPGVISGMLDNGVQYRVLAHANPPGRASLRLHLPVGSSHEADEERGFAHLLEHLAFAGSENFAPGEVVPYFESLGMSFGRHQNAYTSVDQTVYLLELPDTADATLNGGLTFLADVLGRLTLPDERVEQERAVVLAEWRNGLGPAQRMMEQWFPRVLHGSRVADRLPIGTERTIRDAQRDALAAFYRRWYRTGNATVVFVGEVDPERARALITAAFGALPAAPATAPINPGVVRYERSFAVVATDPETVGAQVGFVQVWPDRPPVTTVDAFRARLVESVATYAFNRRLAERVAAGEVAFRGGGASAGDFFGAGWLAAVHASGDAAHWARMLAELAAEIKRAVAHGFDAREVDDARRTMTASARQFARAEPTVPAGVIAGMILEGVQDGTPVQSGEQRLALLERLLPGITADEASAAFRRLFAPDRFAATVYMVEGEHVPDEAEVLPVAFDAFAATVDARGGRERAERLLAVIPGEGTVVEHTVDAETGVWSAWFDNGVRAHHRYMDYRENQAGIRITLSGGGIEEDAATRAHTLAAFLTLQRYATRSLSSTDIRDLMIGRTVGVGLSVREDAVILSVDGTPDQLEHGLQLVYLLLTEPLLEPVAFGQWRQATLQELAARARDPAAQVAERLDALRYPPDDPRWRPFAAPDFERLDLDAVQRWLDAFVRRAPIEAAVVGDIPLEQAQVLVARYLGSLPPRVRIAPDPYAALRVLPPPRGGIVDRSTVNSVTPQAAVVVGFAGADDANLDDVRALNQAARVLTTRMLRRLREQEGLVYAIGANHSAGVALPGYGSFSSGAAADPAHAGRLADLIDEMYANFAAEGPTDEEAAIALRQFENAFREIEQEPGYWLGRLSVNSFRDDDPVSPAQTLAGYRAVTAARMHEAFRRYYNSDSGFRLVVVPDDP